MDEIYDKYFYKIYKWSIKKTNTKEDAEDLTNNIFLSIFEYLGKNIEINKLDNLIWKIAHNIWCTKAKEYIKDKNNTILDGSFEYSENIVDKIIYKEIVTNIDKIGLTEREKITFEMYYLKDLSIKEISKKTGYKETTIKYYLYNARNKIKEKYNE